MGLWIVYTGWQGNGAEGVIVEADDVAAARSTAYTTLVAACQADIARFPAGSRPASEAQSHMANYAEHWESWRVETITLPYVGEFG